MRNTKERIERNRNIALMRLKDRTDSSARRMVEELFWPPEIWPDHIVNCFMKFKYNDRICICNFFFGNGMQLIHAFRLIKFHHSWSIATENRYSYTFTQLWIRIESAVERTHLNWEHIISSYYFYSMCYRCVMFFDGHIRVYGTTMNILNNANIIRNQIIPHNTSLQQRTQAYRDNQNNVNMQNQRDHRMRLERRWRFLASIDRDPIIIDGLTFKFDAKLYTNVID